MINQICNDFISKSIDQWIKSKAIALNSEIKNTALKD